MPIALAHTHTDAEIDVATLGLSVFGDDANSADNEKCGANSKSLPRLRDDDGQEDMYTGGLEPMAFSVAQGAGIVFC